MKSVIFDLDGTLADTSGDLLAAGNACFRDMGYGDVLTLQDDAGIAMRGGRMMLRTGLARLGKTDFEDIVDRYYPVLIDAYDAAIDVHTTLYPRAMEVVEGLKSQGYGVGICTNKPERLAEKLMTRLGVREAFGALVGADTVHVAKPDPAPLIETVRRLGGDPRTCCLVGDSVTDRKTAQAAGVPSILVTFGPDGADMAALEPEALISDYAELPQVVARLL